MQQSFIIMLETPEELDRLFPDISADQMSVIVRDGLIAKSCSFMGEMPFRLQCQSIGLPVSSFGKMREFNDDDFPGNEENSPLLLEKPETRLF